MIGRAAGPAGSRFVARNAAARTPADPAAKRAGSRYGGSITMQSTGQAGTHSSQPVHSASTTVCMNFGAPTMASTGQAWMHLVQLADAAAAVVGPGVHAEQLRQRACARIAAGRAMVDAGLAARHRFRVWTATVVTALTALGLRKYAVEAFDQVRCR